MGDLVIDFFLPVPSLERLSHCDDELIDCVGMLTHSNRNRIRTKPLHNSRQRKQSSRMHSEQDFIQTQPAQDHIHNNGSDRDWPMFALAVKVPLPIVDHKRDVVRNVALASAAVTVAQLEVNHEGVVLDDACGGNSALAIDNEY